MYEEVKGEEKERIGKLQMEIMRFCERKGYSTREGLATFIFLSCAITKLSGGKKEDLLDSIAMTFDNLPEPKCAEPRIGG